MTALSAHEQLLRILGVESESPSLPALKKLTLAFVLNIPFENISKLLSLEGLEEDRIPPFDIFVENVARRQLGGTCLVNNPHFCELLRHVGYDAALLGADMGEKRNVHTSVGVALNGKRYHLDAGYGAHFLEPVDLDDLPAEIRLGPRRYAFEENADGRLRVSVWDNGELVHGYIVNSGQLTPEVYRWSVADSYRPESEFLNCLRIIKQTEESMFSLRNRRLTVTSATGNVTKEFNSYAELEECVKGELGLTGAPLRETLEILEEYSGVHLFGNAPNEGKTSL
jgi:arylamine N-acetyltransferase